MSNSALEHKFEPMATRIDQLQSGSVRTTDIVSSDNLIPGSSPVSAASEDPDIIIPSDAALLTDAPRSNGI